MNTSTQTTEKQEMSKKTETIVLMVILYTVCVLPWALI